MSRGEIWCTEVRKGRTTRVETAIRDSAGFKRYMDVITAPVFGASDKPIRMLAIWRDVTEARKARDEAEAARHEAERLAERLSAVLESTMDSVLVVDRSWRISYFNIKAMRLLQLDEHAIGLDLWKVFPADGNSVFAIEFRWAMADRSNVSFEEYLEPRGIWLEMHAAPTSEGMSLFFRDIT